MIRQMNSMQQKELLQKLKPVGFQHLKGLYSHDQKGSQSQLEDKVSSRLISEDRDVADAAAE